VDDKGICGEHEIDVQVARRIAGGGFDQTVRYSAFAFVAYVCGVAGLNIAAAMLIPMVVDMIDGNPDWQVFLTAAVCIGFVCLALVFAFGGRSVPFSRRLGFLTVNALWVTVVIFAAVPYAFSGLSLSWADAIFESVSGLTTTGSTVLQGLESMPRGLLLWRSLTQGIGGIGIIAMSVILMPLLRIGGMQVYRMESSAQEERPVARFSQFASNMLLLYGVLTLACAACYALAGMTPFVALNHALTTVSTGGFSTYDTSLIGLGPGVHLVAIVFMIAGSLPFLAYLRALAARDIRKAYDPQIPVLLGIFAVLSVLAFIAAPSHSGGAGANFALMAVFNVVSIVTTTGFATSDYLSWGPMAVGVFLIATFLGGAAGSTSGGLKTFRLIVMFKMLHLALREVVFPRGVTSVHYGGVRMSEQAMRSVGVFVITFLAILLIETLILSATGLDIVTGFSASLTALTNTGPGVSALIGPTGNFASLPEIAKWSLAVTMLLGRLEIMTVLVLLTPLFWRG